MSFFFQESRGKTWNPRHLVIEGSEEIDFFTEISAKQTWAFVLQIKPFRRIIIEDITILIFFKENFLFRLVMLYI